MKKLFPLLPLALLFSGCATTDVRLPAISANEVYIKHQNPLFSVNVDAENVVDHGAYITADKLTYDRDGRFTTTSIIVKGYRRDKKVTPQD